MSVRKLTASLLTALAIMGGVASVSAQEHTPVADPFAFDPDFHWFEPVYDVDLADMKPQKRAHTGWFATYDRLNLYASRPETDDPNNAETKLDSGWGNRYQVGYMLPGDDKGWLFNWTEMGVGSFFTVRQERLNRLIVNPPGFTPVAPPFGVAVRQREDNNRGYNFRFVDINETYNVFSYDSYELNKTWRMKPYHYGGILEPMIGVRWMRVDDLNGFMTYQSVIDNPPLIAPNVTNGELVTNSLSITKNEMLGGQVGFRYFKFQDRFTYSSDFRVFFGGNYQCSESSVSTELTDYSGIGVGSTVTAIFTDQTEPIFTRNEEFFVGFDVRGEIGYQLTKLISLRAGFQVVDIARGVWRGGDGSVVEAGDNDQDLVMLGGTFGINLNH